MATYAARRPRTAEIYQQFVVGHGLERRELLAALRAMFIGEPVVLYPGCFVHVTTSFYFQHVTYVDRLPFARDFFADAAGVKRLVRAEKTYKQTPWFEFLQADYLRRLPVNDRSVDLVLALYAPGVARACTRYLRAGGLLVSNHHGGDALEAKADERLELVAAIRERRGKIDVSHDVAGELVRRPRQRRGQRQGRPQLTREADYYVFRRRGR
jgi:hypothetical protein